MLVLGLKNSGVDTWKLIVNYQWLIVVTLVHSHHVLIKFVSYFFF